MTGAAVAAARFGWPGAGITPIAGGHINDSFLVTHPAGEYVLQRLNRGVFTDLGGMTANSLAVHRHLGTGLVPEPVPAADGRWLVEDGDDRWRAWRRVPDAGPCTGLDAAAARSAGALLGRFHAGVADLDPSRLAVPLPRFHDLRRRLAALEVELAADRCGRARGAADEIARVREAAPLVGVAGDLADRVPVRTAHFDAKLDNVLFRRGEAVCLVDLDTVMPGPWFWDLGDLLRTAATTAAEDASDPAEVTVDPALYDAVVSGYRAAVPAGVLTPAEVEAVTAAGAVATYEQAVRFLSDWLAGDVYFRTTRPGHNLERARAQLALLATLPSPLNRP